MPTQLSIALITFAAIIIIFTSVLLVRSKIPVKYSLLWYAFALLILLSGIIPNLFFDIAGTLGFTTLSNFMIAFILVVLILLNIALTVMIASQRHRINLVSQELALLQKSLHDQTAKKSKSQDQKNET